MAPALGTVDSSDMTDTQAINNAGTQAINMTGTQAINIAGTQAINIAGTQAATTFTLYNKCPVEIREMIIADLVFTPDGIRFHDTSGRVRLPAGFAGLDHITAQQRRTLLPNYFLVSKDFFEAAARLFLTQNTFHLKAGCAAYDNVVHIVERGRLDHADLRMRIRHVVLHAEVGMFALPILDRYLAASVRRMITAGSLRTIEVRMYGAKRRFASSARFRVCQEIRANWSAPPHLPVLPQVWSMQVAWRNKALLLVRLLLHPALQGGSMKVMEEQHPAAWCTFLSSDAEEPGGSYHSHCLACTSLLKSADDDDAHWLDVDVEALARLYRLLPRQ